MQLRPAFLLAPGAGASTSHPRMQAFSKLLSALGDVHPFDYPYRLEGRGRPDPLPRLVAAHRTALEALREQHSGPIILVGKSMGGRVGCHLALTETVTGVICLGFPLLGGGNPAKLRDQVLLDLETPILFVQGTRDPLCPLDRLAPIRERMRATNAIHVVDGGDHSLMVLKRQLKMQDISQPEVDGGIQTAIGAFIGSLID